MGGWVAMEQVYKCVVQRAKMRARTRKRPRMLVHQPREARIEWAGGCWMGQFRVLRWVEAVGGTVSA